MEPRGLEGGGSVETERTRSSLAQVATSALGGPAVLVRTALSEGANDAGRVSTAVLEAATSADPSSELDSVQVLATRAVRKTYAVLIAQLRATNETSISLDAAIPGASDPIVRQILSGLRLERRSEADPIE